MNKFSLIVAILISMLFSVQDYGSVTVDKVLSVYDGDTINVQIDQYPAILGDNISVRVFGIDTPEIRSKNPQEKQLALKARDYVRNIIQNSQTVVLKNMKRGKYFRILANVEVDGKDLAEMLVDKGYAVRYYGEKKPIW